MLAPLREGEADAARAAIAALDEPFARVPGTHLARVQVLRPPPRRFRGRTRHYVLLAADHDGPGRAVAGRRRRASSRRRWPTARSGPGPTTRPRSCAGRGRASCGAGFSVVGSPHASVEEVGAALALRERVAALAAQTDGPRRRGAAGRLAGAGDRRRRPPGRDRARLRPALRLRPPPLRPRARAAGRAGLPGRARRPGDDRAGVGRAPGHDAQRRALVPRAERRSSCRRGSSTASRRSSATAWRRAPSASATTPAAWEDELRELEVLLVVHAQSADALEDEAGRWERALRARDSGLELAHVQPARAARRAARALRLHRRLLAAGHRGRRPRGRPRPGHPLQARAVVAAEPHALARDQAGRVRPGLRGRGPRPAPAPPAPFDRNASFMVWRKLHQDVAGFRAQLAEQAQRLRARRGARRGQAGRALARRQPAGAAPDAPDPALGNDKERANDFRYGDDPLGLRCPRGAHVRRTNPRDALGWEGRLTARHRILRRGMPYGPAAARRRRRTTARRAGCSSSACRPRSRASSRSSRRSGATTATRSAWAARPTRSPAPPAARCATSSRAIRRSVVSPLRSYVECRGGEYLVVPAISALRALPAL